jgi:rhodanese-related sulfurtransferase
MFLRKELLQNYGVEAKIINKQLVILGIVALLVSVGLSGCNSTEQTHNNQTPQNSYTNITVEQAYNLLTNTSNGIQIPIDVRTNSEWETEHIDTSYPENPQHWPNLQNGDNLTSFLSTYQGKEIVVYCRTGVRSFNAVKLLIANGFTGKIYNMVGGIVAWTTAGYPTNSDNTKKTQETPSNGANQELNKFIGIWINASYGSELIINFSSDGTCIYVGNSGTWDLKDDKLTIEPDYVFDYAFSDNNRTLILTSQYDITTVYSKQ